MPIFEYGEIEINSLKARDAKLGRAIDQIGLIRRQVTPDLFTYLIYAIVDQQISTKAGATIRKRMCDRLGEITPRAILDCSTEEIQALGMSMRKAAYIMGAADAVHSGALDLGRLHSLSDDEVRKELSALKGVGVWTAEMLMIFSMQRPDILSFNDLAIQRGLRMLYRHRQITVKLFEKYKRRYSPYASVASLYLWAIAGGEGGFTDPA